MVERFKPKNGYGQNGHRNGKSNGSNQYTKDLIHRGSVFKPAYVEQAKKACKAGFTDIELAQLFGVSEMTINNWKLRYPEFALALQSAKDVADERMERSFYQRGIGYSYESEKVVTDSTGFERVTREAQHIPGDVTAQWRWLLNRRPDRWREVHEVEGTIRNEHIFTFNIFENDLSASMKTIEGKKATPRLEGRP
jgi:hypothetical protein